MTHYTAPQRSNMNGKIAAETIAAALAGRGFEFGREVNRRPGTRHDFLLSLPNDTTAVIECKSQGSADGTLYQKWWYSVHQMSDMPYEHRILVVARQGSVSDAKIRELYDLARSLDPPVQVMRMDRFYRWLEREEWRA